MADEIIKQENEKKTSGTRRKSASKNNSDNTKSAETAKSVEKEPVVNTAEVENSVVKAKSNKFSLADIANLVNAVVETVFVERNGTVEFAAEYYEVILAYWSIRYFYPDLVTEDTGIFAFFNDYIEGAYKKQLSDLEYNTYWKYASKAIAEKVEQKKRQLENPVVTSLTNFLNTANILAQKYVDDIDNVGAADIKSFLNDFGKLAEKTNSENVTRAVLEANKRNLENEAANAKNAKKNAAAIPKNAKKIAEGE